MKFGQLLPQSASLTAPSEREPSLPPSSREVSPTGDGGRKREKQKYLVTYMLASIFHFTIGLTDLIGGIY